MWCDVGEERTKWLEKNLNGFWLNQSTLSMVSLIVKHLIAAAEVILSLSHNKEIQIIVGICMIVHDIVEVSAI